MPLRICASRLISPAFAASYTAVRPCTGGEPRRLQIPLSAPTPGGLSWGAGDLEPAEQHMTLDGDALNQLLGDAIMGKDEPSIEGDEARTYFEKVKKQVAEMIANGQSPDMLKN